MKKRIVDKNGNQIKLGDILTWKKCNEFSCQYEVIVDNNGNLLAVPYRTLFSDKKNYPSFPEELMCHMYIVE
jgi:hypothetical protein